MSRAVRLGALGAGSALLFALALPNELTPWGSPLAGAVCIAPFLAAVSLCRSTRSASLVGALFGALSTALSSFWLMFFQEFAVWTLGGVVLAYTGFNALLGAVLHGAARVGGARYRPFLLAGTWVVYEYLKSTGFLGYPWGLVAYPVHGILPLVQIADATGVWGVSLLVALVNAALAEGLIRLDGDSGADCRVSVSLRDRLQGWPRQIALVAILVAASAGYGVLRLRVPDGPEAGGTRELDLVLVQQNTNPWEPFDEIGIMANQRLSEQALREARSGGIEPDLVVWSETSLPWDPEANARSYARYPKESPFLPYLRRSGVPHLVGTVLDVDPAKNEWMNGAVLLLPGGGVAERYGKQHPVPFAEAIPFWESRVVQAFFTNAVGIQMPWVMGTRSVVFQLPLREGGQAGFGVPICFEDAFSDLCRRFVLGGADLLINLTNDSWSRTVSALTQHFVVARFRAVENRRTLARSTNGGVTAIVDARGRIVEMIPWFQPGYVLAAVRLPAAGQLSTYTRFGDWLPLLLAAALVVALAASAMRRGRRPGWRPIP